MRSASDRESLVQRPSPEPRDIALLDTHGDRLLAQGVAHSGLPFGLELFQWPAARLEALHYFQADCLEIRHDGRALWN